MNYAALKAELAKPEYAGMSDDEAAAAINATTVIVKRPVQSADARRYLMLTGKWPRITSVARGLIAPADEGQALSAVALVEGLSMIDSFDLEVPAYKAAVEAQLNACVATSLIDANDVTGILDFANVSTTWADGFGSVTPSDVANAKRSP